MIFLTLGWYLAFCCCMFAFYEGLKLIFADRIIANGWFKTQDYTKFEEELPEDYNPYNDLQFYISFFIPVFNLFVVGDLIYIMLHKPEEVA